MKRSPIRKLSGSAAAWLALATLTTSAHAFTYGITLPAAPDGFAWVAQSSSYFWTSTSTQLTNFPLASGIISPGTPYDQSNSITNQGYNHNIGAFSVADDPERFFLITSQMISTRVEFSTTDVFASFDPNNGSSFDATRTASLEFTGGGSVPLGNTSLVNTTGNIALTPLQALAIPRYHSVSDSVFLTGNDIDFDGFTLSGTVSLSHRLEVTDPATGGAVVGSSFDSAYVSSYRELSYTRYNLEAIPEPSTALLGALGMFALLRRQRRD